ncbi:putative phage virion morphogenesis protein [Campylobacter iguaniorum]|uniref:Putative phage virion morphogenesis protein n=1 Tax=Campylobacter iguaniorum TaxID=1244531 RepID=A0A076F9B0_9BACT|nr:phage virion morphogenesis protein [Campylobacter iguaniorum]AII14805.1 putative phage virion morphogenesis protein [Campylobacter iguaniorum]
MSVKITGFEKIEKKLEQLRNLGTNVKPFLSTAGQMIRNEIEGSFEKETSPFGERWKPLSASTIFSEIKGGMRGSMVKQSINF